MSKLFQGVLTALLFVALGSLWFLEYYVHQVHQLEKELAACQAEPPQTAPPEYLHPARCMKAKQIVDILKQLKCIDISERIIDDYVVLEEQAEEDMQTIERLKREVQDLQSQIDLLLGDL